MRSPRWITTSISEDRWNTDLAKYCSADYHVNNLTSPVYFYEALQKVPPGAVMIEVCLQCCPIKNWLLYPFRTVIIDRATHASECHFASRPAIQLRQLRLDEERPREQLGVLPPKFGQNSRRRCADEHREIVPESAIPSSARYPYDQLFDSLGSQPSMGRGQPGRSHLVRLARQARQYRLPR